MIRKYILIAKVWAYRPMMWLLAIFTLLIFILFSAITHVSDIRRAFIPPYEYSLNGSIKLSRTSILSNGNEFREFAILNKVDPTIEGINLTPKQRFGRSDPFWSLKFPSVANQSNRNKLDNNFPNYEKALAISPSVRWIRFGKDQIQHVSIDTWSKLAKLETIIINDDQITQADIEKISEIRNLKMLVLESFDLSASLAPLSNLPKLNTLVLLGASSDIIEGSLFRPEILNQIHTLRNLQKLILMPQWDPTFSVFNENNTAHPGWPSNLKKNVREILPGHPTLTDLWIGLSEEERSFHDLKVVQDGMPNVKVRLAHYNEGGIFWASLGFMMTTILIFLCLHNVLSHFSTSYCRTIPNYRNPHLRFVFGFALFAILLSTIVIQLHESVAWLPALVASVFAVTLGTFCASFKLSSPLRAAFIYFFSMAFFALGPLLHPLLIQHFPAFAPVLDQFLAGYYSVLSMILTASFLIISLPTIYWRIHRLSNYDRILSETGLPPFITVKDGARQQEILKHKNKGNQRALVAWQLQLEELKLKSDSWIRSIRLDWMGEQMRPRLHWIGFLFIATAITFAVIHFSSPEQKWRIVPICTFAFGFMCLFNPFISSISRQDSLSTELLLPHSRDRFIIIRTLSLAEKFSLLLLGFFTYVTILNYILFQELNLKIIIRASVLFIPITMAGTGISLWALSVRNIFARGLLIGATVTTLIFTIWSSIDAQRINKRDMFDHIPEIEFGLLIYIVSYLVTGFLLWTGYQRLLICEFDRK